MEIVITEYQHCDLIKIIGRIDSYTSPKIDQTLKSLIEDNHFKFVIDMSEVSYISSSGILTLIHAQKECQRLSRGEIILACVPDLVHSSFRLAGFTQVFNFYDDVVSAVGKF